MERPIRPLLARLPWLTWSLVAASAAASSMPGFAELLEFRRAAVAGGELWRPVTGQFVHWTARMTLFDLGTVLLLGSWLEPRCRRVAVAVSVASVALIGLGLLLLTELSAYRGASGLASALFVATALALFRVSPRPGYRWLSLACLALFGAKTVWELATGKALAAGPLPAGVTVTPVVHLIGSAAGLLGWRVR